MMIVKLFKRIYFMARGCIYQLYYMHKVENRVKCVNVLSMLTTLRLAMTGCSLIRFGDGELKWMLNIHQSSFQDADDNLRKDLYRVFTHRNEKLLIALVPNFGSLKMLNFNARSYWARELCMHREEFESIIDKNYTYGNANVSRFYIDYLDKSHVDAVVNAWKELFTGRKLLIIEGRYTRSGVGNDLFSEAESIERILCPAVNAYEHKNKIISKFLDHSISKDVLVLLALGPTAKVVGVELFSLGWQVLDIGHLDVEYQWKIMKAKKKEPIKGKYVNEAGGWSEELDKLELQEYERQVIDYII